MTKKIKVSELPEFDAAEYLNSEEDIAAYLAAVTEENDPELLASAQEDITRAREIAQSTKKVQEKPKHKLADLLAQCDYNAAPPSDMAAWDAMKPVGKEDPQADIEFEPPRVNMKLRPADLD